MMTNKETKILLLLTIGVMLNFSLSYCVDNGCLSCHKEIDDPIAGQYEKSIHFEAKIGCSDCHGGDPKELEDMDIAMSKEKGFKGVPKGTEITELCGSCHSDVNKMRKYNLRTDQLANYKTSIHGQKLYESNDTNVAVCTSCHGKHLILKPSHPESTVYKVNIPKTCSTCHSNAELMSQYNIPTDQYSKYLRSYHGTLLMRDHNLKVASCADCHGIHGAKPPGISEIADVCGNCHSTTLTQYRSGAHAKSLEDFGKPKCIDCHDHHEILFPDEEMFLSYGKGVCYLCHENGSSGSKRANKLHELLTGAKTLSSKAKLALEQGGLTEGEVESLKSDMLKADTSITEAIITTHTLDITKVSEFISLADKLSQDIIDKVNEKKESLQIRKKAIVLVLVVAAILIFLLLLKKKKYEQEEKALQSLIPKK
ncbi:cytochrome c3 family protein [bacterium]|nr:cytochrome c3 family protein [bacterium]